MISFDFRRQLQVLLKWVVSSWLRMEPLPLHWIPDITELLSVARGILSFHFLLLIDHYCNEVNCFKRFHDSGEVMVYNLLENGTYLQTFTLAHWGINENGILFSYFLSLTHTHSLWHEVLYVELWTRYGTSFSVAMDSGRKSLSSWIQKTWHFVMVNLRMSIALYNSHSPNPKRFNFEATVWFLWYFV